MLEELKRTTCRCTPLAVHAPICVRSPNFSFHFWATTLFLSPLSCWLVVKSQLVLAVEICGRQVHPVLPSNAPLADINSFLKRISQRNAKLARILRLLLSTTQSSSFFVVHELMFGGRGGPNTHFTCRFESRPTYSRLSFW